MALKYTSVEQFLRRYGIINTIPEFNVGTTPTKETVASATVTAGDYYLDHIGVVSTTLILYAGSTALTETTHYTFDAQTSKITITSDGATALSGEDLTAEYSYSTLGSFLKESDVEAILNSAECEFEDDTDMVFSNTTSPTYRQVTNEILPFTSSGKSYRLKTAFNTYYNPIVNLQTTVNGAFTLTDTTLTLTDATGFPDTGTIYVGANKVTYTAKSGNDLTVPNTTPSIADGVTVRGEVVEVSLESEGNVPSWQVLTFDKDYEVYSYEGYIKMLSSAYYNQVTVSDMRLFPENVRLRISYMQAWHEKAQDPYIPYQVVDVIYSIAARMLSKRTVRKSQFDKTDFDPAALNVDEKRISDLKLTYCNQNMEIR